LEIEKVVILGPECTGKSELSEYLANEFTTLWVPEYARSYISSLSRPYGPQDLPAIARGQLAQEDLLSPEANRVLICDTNLYVIKVWSYFKFGFCDVEILKSIESRKYDLYLLTYIDIPWVADPQREHPDQRDLLYEIYLEEMKNQAVPFVEVKGNREQRRRTARESIIHLLQASPENDG
jgi:NadR type nicotinamide-nucleotide adenylyltransferase